MVSIIETISSGYQTWNHTGDYPGTQHFRGATMYRKTGILRPLAGTTRFYVTVGDYRSAYLEQEEIENMLNSDTKAQLYMECAGESHSVGFVVMHQNGQGVVLHFNLHKYYIEYQRFVRCLLGSDNYAPVAERVAVQVVV